MVHGGDSMDPGRIKQGDRTVLIVDQEADLRTAEDDGLGAFFHEMVHDSDILFL